MRAVELEPDDPKIKLEHIISFYDDGLVEEAYRMFCEIPDEHPARDKADKWIAKLEEEFQENEMLEPYDDYYDEW